MGYGGATWETAGTLDLGGGNDYTVADGDEPYRRGFWKFTATARKLVTLSLFGSDFVGSSKVLTTTVYRGDETPGSAVFVKHGTNGFVTFYTAPGVTYRIMVRPSVVGEVDDVLTYVVSYSQADPLPAVTGWKSGLYDQEQLLVVTGGDLAGENPPEFQTPQGWWDNLIERDGPPGRDSDYTAQETLGGPDPNDALPCVWSHATFGDNDTTLWDTICDPLIAGFADPALNVGVDFSLSCEDPATSIVGVNATAEISMVARGLWLLHALHNLAERGLLAFPDPEADGLTPEQAATAEIEWQSPLQLLKVEVTGDIGGRPAGGTVDEGVTFFLNDLILPGYSGGAWADRWRKGTPGTLIDGGPPHRMFDYADGDPTWVELDEFTGFDDCADYTSAEPPDTLVGIGMTTAVLGPMPANNTSASNGSDIAVRLTLRSPRYRWVYDGPTSIPPRRIRQRSDGATHGATRVRGGGNTAQTGNRTHGSIL